MSINPFSCFGRQLKKASKYLILFSICVTLAVGCNSSQTQVNTAPVDNNQISVGTTLKPRTLDPADNYELVGLNIIYNVAESLYTNL